MVSSVVFFSLLCDELKCKTASNSNSKASKQQGREVVGWAIVGCGPLAPEMFFIFGSGGSPLPSLSCGFTGVNSKQLMMVFKD